MCGRTGASPYREWGRRATQPLPAPISAPVPPTATSPALCPMAGPVPNPTSSLVPWPWLAPSPELRLGAGPHLAVGSAAGPHCSLAAAQLRSPALTPGHSSTPSCPKLLYLVMLFGGIKSFLSLHREGLYFQLCLQQEPFRNDPAACSCRCWDEASSTTQTATPTTRTKFCPQLDPCTPEVSGISRE